MSSFSGAGHAALHNTEVKWLLLNPDSDYVAARVKDNPVYAREQLRYYILSGISRVLEAKNVSKLEKFHIRLYDEPAVFRVIIVDSEAYLSYYPKGSADSVPVWVIEKGKSWLFDAIDKHFESLWERSDGVSKELLSKLQDGSAEGSEIGSFF